MPNKKNGSIEKLFLIFILGFGVFFALLAPVGTIPDEQYHFNQTFRLIFHSDQKISDMDRLPDSAGVTDISFDGPKPTSLYAESYTRKVPFVEQTKFQLNFTWSGLRRLPQAIGILIGRYIYPSYGVMFLVGRLFNLLFYAGVIYIAIKKAAFGKFPMVFVALLPMSVQQAASLSYDTSLFAVCFVTFSMMSIIWTRAEKLNWKWALGLGTLVGVSYLTKSSALILLSLLATIPAKGHLRALIDGFWGVFKKHKRVTFLLILLGLLGVFGFIFKDQGGLLNWFQVMFNTYFSTAKNTNLDLVVTSGIFGAFGRFQFYIPEWLIILNFILFAMLLLSEKKVKLQLRVTVISALLFVMNILLTSSIYYITYTHGQLGLDVSWSLGEQGRYYTPFLLFLIPLGIACGEDFWKSVSLKMAEFLRARLTFFMAGFNLLLSIVLIYLYWY
ncbi:MAG: DUF2142 domain-containing protein [Streptococcaceae bacterium]|jgi:uncharacterized membrane protein|nr:DUF2142 domain-containing protein [Streptococcaceae bacterium]